jgi:RHS repeat-associated protein
MNKRTIRWSERVALVSLLIIAFIAPSPYAVWQAYQADKHLSEAPTESIEPKIEEANDVVVTKNAPVTNDETPTGVTSLAKNPPESIKSSDSVKLKKIQEPKKVTGKVIAENYDGVKYDEKKQKLTIENPIGEIKAVTFNDQNLPEKTTDVEGNTTTAKYDENGNITEMKAPNGDIVHYNYDKKGRLLSSYTEKDSDTKKLSFWDKLFNSNSATADDKEDVTNLSYSETDEIANIENEAGIVTQEFTDDGNLAVSVDASGNLISYDYDELGNIIGKKANAPEVELSMLSSLFVNAADETTQEEAQFAYDEEGNPEISDITISVPEEKAEITPEEETIMDKLVSYIPRVQAKKMTLKKITKDGEFDAQGNLAGFTNQNGEVTAFYFDENDNPVGSATADKEGKLIYEVKYTKDENGYWNTKIDSLGNNETYVYDEKGQLAKYLSNGQETIYTYDERGNITTEETSIGTVNYLYDHNKLTRIDNPDGSSVTFNYDQNGNLIDKTECPDAETCQSTIYSYTTNNYLESVTTPEGKTIFYAYDGLNRRVSKTVDGITTTYLWEGNNLTAELDQNKNVQRQFVYDNENNLLSVIKNGIVYNLIKDSHGSTVALTDEDSKIVARFTYDAWGSARGGFASENPTETLKDEISPFLYSGYYYDEDIDSYIMGPRFYDPAMKRFFQKDPAPADLDNELTLNEYIYCENNPINNYDPDGHKSQPKNNGKSDKAAKEKAEKAKREAEKREQEQKKKEAEAKRKQQKEAEEKAKKAKEAAEREKKKAQELAEKKAKEAKEKAEKERKQKEAAQKKAKEAAEKAKKEQAEKEKKAKAEAQKKAKEAKEKAEKAKAEAEKKAKRDQEKKAKELKEAKEKAEKARKQAQEKAEKARARSKKEADQKAKKAKEEAQKKQTALTKSYTEAKDIKRSVEKKIQEAKKKKKKVEDLLVLKELYYYQREYQKVSGQKQSVSVGGNTISYTKSNSSLDDLYFNGTSIGYKPNTIKTNLGQNNFLKDSNQKLSINNITPISAGDSLKDFIDGLAYLAKEIAVTTYDESKVCIKNGDIQKCLSTCGIAGDAVPVVGSGVAIACDSVNSLVYLFQGDYKLAGLSTLAILPYAGTVAKQGGKTMVKLEKEALEVAEKSLKNSWKHTAYKCLIDKDTTGKIYSNLQMTSDGKFRYFVNGERFTPKSEMDFILQDGKLKFGEKHSFLSNGKDVDYAGKIYFKSDATKIDSWIPDSGHYKPSNFDVAGQEMVKDAFKQQFGVDLPKMTLFNN